MLNANIVTISYSLLVFFFEIFDLSFFYSVIGTLSSSKSLF